MVPSVIAPLASLSCTTARPVLVKHKHRETINKGNVARMQWRLQLCSCTEKTVARSAFDSYLPVFFYRISLHQPSQDATLTLRRIHLLFFHHVCALVSLRAKWHPLLHDPKSHFLYCVKLFSLFIRIYFHNDFKLLYPGILEIRWFICRMFSISGALY